MLKLDKIEEFYTKEDKLIVMQEIIPNMQLELKEKKETLLMLQIRRTIFSDENTPYQPENPLAE